VQTKNSKQVFENILKKHNFDFLSPNLHIAKKAFFEFLKFQFEKSEPEFFDNYPETYNNQKTKNLIYQDTEKDEFQGLIEYNYFSSGPSHPHLILSFTRQFSYEQNNDYYGMSICYLTFSKNIILSPNDPLNITGKSIWLFDEKDFQEKINFDKNFNNFLNIEFSPQNINFDFKLI